MKTDSIKAYNNNYRNHLGFGSIDYNKLDPLAKEIKAVIPKLKEEAKDLYLQLSCTQRGSTSYVCAEVITQNSLKARLKKIPYLYKLGISKDFGPKTSQEDKEKAIIDTAKRVMEEYRQAIKTEEYVPDRGDDLISMAWYGITDFFKNIKKNK